VFKITKIFYEIITVGVALVDMTATEIQDITEENRTMNEMYFIGN
jgi:hypothetical protein